MAEPQITKPQETKQETPPKGNARIPVTKFWLREGERIDLPGNSLASCVDCAPQKAPGRQFYVAHFVPAHQVIELEHWKNEKAEPYRTRIPLALLSRFD